MAEISVFLTERITAWTAAAGLDFSADDPIFVREVLEPMIELLGENIPTSNAKEIIAARIAEEMPDLDGTVFADLCGKTAAAVFLPLYAELRASLNRRKLTNERLLTGTDLGDLRDVFLVDPTQGGYSSGVVRVYYATPRAVQVVPTQRIVVKGRDGAVGRVYRPTAPQQYTLAEVRTNVSGSRYYIDVALVASAPGEEYDLDVNEAQGAAGFPGSVAVTNLVRFGGGSSADTISTLLARIRTAARLRSPSTFAGAEYALQAQGFTDFRVVTSGSPLMVRDRIYGPGTISGIPGGFRVVPPPVPDSGTEPWVSLGVAFDTWISPAVDERIVSVQVNNLVDEGAEILAGNDGTFKWDSSQPAGEQFTLQTTSFRFREVVGLDDLFPSWPGGLYPVQEGDIVEFEGIFADVAAGIRVKCAVTVVVNGGELRVNPLTPLDPSGVTSGTVAEADYDGTGTHSYAGAHWRVLRHITPLVVVSDATHAYPTTSIPFTDPRAYSAEGVEIEVSGYPALTRPYSTEAESEAGSTVPRTSNVIADASVLPAIYPARVELGDALTGSPSGDFSYLRRYLFAEFLDSQAGTAEGKAVRARVHLLGPMAAAFPPGCIFRDAAGLTRMYPMGWLFEDVTSDGTGAETDTLIIPWASPTQLRDELSASGGPTILGRVPVPGDWAHYYVVGSSDPYIMPIITVLSDRIIVAAPDIPAGLTGNLAIYQGTSRSEQIAAGRGPEGTYSVDIWLSEIDAIPDVYTPGDPPLYGTAAELDELYYITQGYDLVSSLPGQVGSAAERSSLVLHGGRLNDGEEVSGRSIYVHTTDARELETVQALVTSDANRPLCLSGLAKFYTPAYVVFSVYYVATDLTAEDAARAVSAAFEEANTVDRLEVSDLVGAVDAAGATYTVNGRAFVLRMNHFRQWESFATKSAIPAYSTGRFILQAVTAVHLVAPTDGAVVDELDESTWPDSHTLRAGGFDAD